MTTMRYGVGLAHEFAIDRRDAYQNACALGHGALVDDTRGTILVGHLKSNGFWD